jgi:hypothetical protein
MITTEVNRRELLRRGAVVAAVGGATLAIPGVAEAHNGHGHRDAELAEVARIHKLESDFHEARSKQDIDFLMTLWAVDSVWDSFGTILRGKREIRAFLLTTGSFTGAPRVAFAPTFKGQVDVHGRLAEIYFECHDVEQFTVAMPPPAPPANPMVTHLFLAGTIRKRAGEWKFWHMTGGAAPLSVDQIYFP